MKKNKLSKIILCLIIILFTSACTIKKDDLENATIYTTVYPIKYLTEYLYSDYGTINSIYPSDINLNEYSPTDKQITEYSKAKLFIYNGLTNEKEMAKTLLNKNKNLLIIDVSYGLSLENDPTELWLSPNNYLMLAKNIKSNLKEYIKSKIIKENIDMKYDEFEEKISIMDAELHKLGKKSQDNNVTIVVSNNTFKYLENYGFNVLSLQDTANLKERKLNSIKSNFKSGKYKYILTANEDAKNEVIQDLVTNYSAKMFKVNTLTLTLTDDYFQIMTDYIDNISKIVS